MENTPRHEVDVCIVGGGPAGMLLGTLLAKQGLSVLVLEQHHNFQREFRGEVVMPRFSRLYDSLGLLDFLKTYPYTAITHNEIWRIREEHGQYHENPLVQVDVEKISPDYPYALWMTQPTLLGALHDKAKESPTFDLWFDASARELLKEGDVTTGVRVVRGGEEIDIHARITVGADGRGSRIATLGGFELAYDEYKFDILWFTMPRPAEGFDDTVRFYIAPDNFFLVAPKYPDMIQIGVSVPPGAFSTYRNQGVEVIRNILKTGPTVIHDFAQNLTDYSPFHPLKAHTALMKTWAKDGLMLIGDAAHTCSPVGAIGVSIASETAAVAAGVILKAFQKKDFSATSLSELQKLREKEVRTIQRIQMMLGKVMMYGSPLHRQLITEGMWIASKLHLPPLLPQRLLVGDKIHLAPELCSAK